jgi:hypothetical protein
VIALIATCRQAIRRPRLLYLSSVKVDDEGGEGTER